MADDGLTRSAMVEQDVETLNPGYRRDVLVAFPRPGLYCILDEAAEASSTIAYQRGASKMKDRRLLGLVRVGPGSDIPNYSPDGVGHSKYWQYVRNSLVDANRDLRRTCLPIYARSTLMSMHRSGHSSERSTNKCRW